MSDEKLIDYASRKKKKDTQLSLEKDKGLRRDIFNMIKYALENNDLYENASLSLERFCNGKRISHKLMTEICEQQGLKVRAEIPGFVIYGWSDIYSCDSEGWVPFDLSVFIKGRHKAVDNKGTEYQYISHTGHLGGVLNCKNSFNVNISFTLDGRALNWEKRYLVSMHPVC